MAKHPAAFLSAAPANDTELTASELAAQAMRHVIALRAHGGLKAVGWVANFPARPTPMGAALQAAARRMLG
jgi:hypothetical protein